MAEEVTPKNQSDGIDGTTGVKRMRQTQLCFSNGKLVAKLPANDIIEEHLVETAATLPRKFESKLPGAPSTDVHGFQLPLQVLSGWKFHLIVDYPCWTSMAAVAGVEYLIKVHGGQVVYVEEDADMTTVVVVCDQYGAPVSYWKNGRRVYSQFVVYGHIENQRVMTRETLDDIPNIHYGDDNIGMVEQGESEDDSADEDMASSDDGVVFD